MHHIVEPPRAVWVQLPATREGSASNDLCRGDRPGCGGQADRWRQQDGEESYAHDGQDRDKAGDEGDLLSPRTSVCRLAGLIWGEGSLVREDLSHAGFTARCRRLFSLINRRGRILHGTFLSGSGPKPLLVP